MKKIKQIAWSIKELDKRWAFKIQCKLGLSNYQMFWLCFVKGFVIGAILL